MFLTFSDNGSGWPNVGWGTLVGQVSAMFSVLGKTMLPYVVHAANVHLLTVPGSDSVAHMAEEVKDAGVVVPRAMWWSFVINIPFTFGMVITYLFCMPSVADAVSDPTGFPFICKCLNHHASIDASSLTSSDVFRQATGSAGGVTGLTIVILFLITMITISAFASTSRQTFAFARDRGLPFSSWLSHVSHSASRRRPLN